MTAVGIQNVVQDIHMVQHSTGTLGHAVQQIGRASCRERV